MKEIIPVSEERLFQHFRSKQAEQSEPNPDDFPEENELCARKLIDAIKRTPSVSLDAALLPPLL